MPEFITSASFIWFLIGFVFLVAELAMPGFILLFFGLGAWITSLCAWLFGVNQSWQIAIFLVSSLLLIALLRRLWMRTFQGLDGGDVDEEKLDTPVNLGQRAVVTKAVSPSRSGEIKYRGSFWRAVADLELAPDTDVMIIEEYPEDRSTFKVGPYTP
ncbi:MAG: NfeD family protein [Proteobacteria bacterium]|nr:NfeD family protein [Pseudomonadota bacterium]